MGDQHQQPFSKMIRFFEVCIPHRMPPKCYSDASKIAEKYRSSERIHTRRSSCSIMLFACYCKPAYTRDFEDWDRKIAANKIWTNLKTFIQEAYTRCLNATSITTGAQGYVQQSTLSHATAKFSCKISTSTHAVDSFVASSQIDSS